MLPESRQFDHMYRVPKFDLTLRDVENFAFELKGFHEEFSDCFLRSESRDNFYRYMSGQFSALERKSIEPIAHAIEGAKVRAMQRFVSDAPWDDARIINKYRNMVNNDLGAPNGAIIFDESGFQKKGEDSVGVGRQYCGSLGKVENCQVGVFAAYVSRFGYALIDHRLYMPDEWFSDENASRREKCKVPTNLEFRTKPQLAVDMLMEIAQEKVLPFRYVLADSVYGTSPEFINALESLPDLTYLVQVARDTLCWPVKPVTISKTYRYGGEEHAKTVLSDKSPKPITLLSLTEGINDFFWYRRKVSEGAKGPIEYEFTKRKIVLAKDGLPTKTLSLLVRRTVGINKEYSFFLCNPFSSERLDTLVWLSGLRWAIEQCFEETKTELGMDQYELRKLPGWYHHILTCMLAHFFLWHLKIRLGKKSASGYGFAATIASEMRPTLATMERTNPS